MMTTEEKELQKRTSKPPLTVEEIRARLRDLLPELQARYHVATLEIFGSYARGEARPDSDVDILVSFSKTPTLFDVVELQYRLSEALNLPVDLTLKDSLKPRLRPFILKEAIAI